jgi:Glyoxalase/Bleomycin resistance protein/Dioxygenase superfamily
MTVLDCFHTGIVVPDVNASMAELTAAAGYVWLDVVDREAWDMILFGSPFRMPGLRFTYSTQPHRLELIEAVPDTLWVEQPAPATSVHHLGFWSDDLTGDSERMSSEGLELVMTNPSPDGRPVNGAYHRLPSGVLVELVDTARKPLFEAWWEGGATSPFV